MKTFAIVIFAMLMGTGTVAFAQPLNPNDVFVQELVLPVTNGNHVYSQVLASDANYYLRVSGTYGYANGNPWMDAAYCYQGPVQGCNPPQPDTGGLDADWFWNNQRNQRPTPDVYNPDHVYYFLFAGNGQAQDFYFYEPNSWDFWDNVGELVIQIYQQAVVPIPNPAGYALCFDGVDDYVSISNPFFGGGTTSSFTIECFMKMSDPTQEYGSVMWGKQAYWQETHFVASDGVVGFEYAYPYSYYVSGRASVAMDVWHHVAVCMDGSVMRLFVDGSLASTGTTNGAISWAADAGSHRLASGIISGGWHFWEGCLEEFRVSSIARYSSDFTPPQSPFENDSYTEVLYHFDEATGSILHDFSSNGNDGILINNPTWTESDVQLPVELLSFEAVPGDRRVSLHWTTASETDNDHFDIERDGIVMGRVQATNSATGNTYNWSESNLINGREYTYSLVSVSISGEREVIGTASATPTINAATISEYALHQNYPNPFNPETNITFDIVESGEVMLKVYNSTGQTVATLVNGTMPSGRHSVTFDASTLPSGLYFYRLNAGDFTAVKKMVLMK